MPEVLENTQPIEQQVNTLKATIKEEKGKRAMKSWFGLLGLVAGIAGVTLMGPWWTLVLLTGGVILDAYSLYKIGSHSKNIRAAKKELKSLSPQQKIKELGAELERLRMENQMLRDGTQPQRTIPVQQAAQGTVRPQRTISVLPAAQGMAQPPRTVPVQQAAQGMAQPPRTVPVQQAAQDMTQPQITVPVQSTANAEDFVFDEPIDSSDFTQQSPNQAEQNSLYQPTYPPYPSRNLAENDLQDQSSNPTFAPLGSLNPNPTFAPASSLNPNPINVREGGRVAARMGQEGYYNASGSDSLDTGRSR